MNAINSGKWSGRKYMPVPDVGTVVNVTMNGLGLATVLSHHVVEGWLGVMVRFHNPPEYYTRQNHGANPPGLVYGAEMRPAPKGKQSYNFKRFARTYLTAFPPDAKPQWIVASVAPGFPRTPLRHAVWVTRWLPTRAISKDHPAIRRTCKALGIKHTYKAIAAFISATT